MSEPKKIECEAIRLATVIESFDKAMVVLSAFRKVDENEDVEVLKELARRVSRELQNGGGQLNWWREEAKQSQVEYRERLGITQRRFGMSYKTKDSHCSESGIAWSIEHPEFSLLDFFHEDSPSDDRKPVVTVDMKHDKFTTFDQLVKWVISRGGDPETISITFCDADDRERASIAEAGFPVTHATVAEELIAEAKSSAELNRKMREERDARSGGQQTDDTIAVNVVQYKPEHIPNVKASIRIKSDGFGVAIDENIEELVRSMADVTYVADVPSDGFVGTWTGMMQEMRYEFEGVVRYMYFVTHSNVDTWCQEWWVSTDRLTGKAAADAIEWGKSEMYKK